MKNEKKVCRECGQVISGEFVEYDGEYVCEDCFDNNYYCCDDCGKVEHRDNGYWIEDKQVLLCEDCFDNNNYYCCEDCGYYFEYTRHIQNHGNVCEHCFDRGSYGYCNGCDNYFRYDDLHYSEHNDCDYCDDCYNENDLLYDYHDFCDWQLFKGKNEYFDTVPYYIGKEIELEPTTNDCLSEVLDVMNNHINAVGMHDGSLNDGGVEVVTHPESWEYLQEHKEDYKEFFDEIEHLGYGDDGDAGLHFHITRPNDNVVARVIVLLESFKEEIKKLSRRNGNFSWSKFMTDTEYSDEDRVKYQSMKYLKEDYVKTHHDRYLALNLDNYRTIEFRFFNGANNFEEFWGALQFIHNLMEVALDEDRDINTISWNELIYGEELISQARKQGVFGIDKKAKETTEIVEKLEKIKEETKNEIKKTLKNFIKYMTKELETKRLEIIDKNNIDDVVKNGRTFIDTFKTDLEYLDSITKFYNNISRKNMKTTRQDVIYYKEMAKNNKKTKYNRYFKKIEDTINKFEKEIK